MCLFEEDGMTRRQYSLITISVTLLTFLLIGCSSTPETIPPTPDMSIVWSDDFDDGDTDGWEPGWRRGEYFVENGVLSFATRADLAHPSTVLHGTWSFDVHIGDDSGTTHEVRFTEGIYNYQMLEIKHSPNTQIWVSTQQDPGDPISSYVDLGEKLAGWHHFDITKAESGLIEVYQDGEFVVGHSDGKPFDAVSVVFYHCCEGPALDNLVVRNQAIDIQPSE
jgi:hypothetical protein